MVITRAAARPYLYGLGATGERGVAAAIPMLGDELRRAMTLMGVTSGAQLRAEGPAARPVVTSAGPSGRRDWGFCLRKESAEAAKAHHLGGQGQPGAGGDHPCRCR